MTDADIISVITESFIRERWGELWLDALKYPVFRNANDREHLRRLLSRRLNARIINDMRSDRGLRRKNRRRTHNFRDGFENAFEGDVQPPLDRMIDAEERERLVMDMRWLGGDAFHSARCFAMGVTVRAEQCMTGSTMKSVWSRRNRSVDKLRRWAA